VETRRPAVNACMRRRMALALVLAALMPACSRSPVAGGTQPQSNVLIVIVDTLRADRLGTYGAERNTSPTIDALASESVLFETAVTSAPRTWQAVASILTGLYPYHHGVRFIYDQPLAARHETVGTILGGHGYHTAAFGFIEFLREVTGGRSFKQHFDPRGRGGVLTDERIADHVGRWIAGVGGQPFLAVVHFRGPHWPYTPRPGHHDALFGGSRAQHDAIDHSFNQGGYGLARNSGKGFDLTDADAYQRRIFGVDPRADVREHILLHYDAAILGIDEILGSLLAKLRQTGVLDQTILVLTSDHGESFGEHGYLQHGPRVDETVLHVPLLIRFPQGSPHGRAGGRIEQLVRTVDIVPTVLDALGLSFPAPLDGQSLLPALKEGHDLQLPAYAESGREFMGVDPELAFAGVSGKQRMLRNLRFKLVYRPRADGPSYSLYDLVDDPGETLDVGPQRPDVKATLQAMLGAIVAADPDVRREEAALSSPQRERLRTLGYVQ
jgi:arylsulfatase